MMRGFVYILYAVWLGVIMLLGGTASNWRISLGIGIASAIVAVVAITVTPDYPTSVLGRRLPISAATKYKILAGQIVFFTFAAAALVSPIAICVMVR